MPRRLITDEEDQVSPIVEDHDETDEEDFQLQYALHQSQQHAAQTAPDSRVAVAPSTLDGSGSLSASNTSNTVKVYASDDTDDILVSALEKHDPLSVTELDRKRSRWQLVALQCKTDSERLFRRGEPYKADYFASGDVTKLKTRWKHLKDKLSVARTRRLPTGTTQNGLSALMVRVEALVEREDSINAARVAKKREEEEKRRNNFHRGVLLAAASMGTVARESSVLEERRSPSPRRQWSSQSDSASSSSPSLGSTRSTRVLPSSGARDLILEKIADMQAMEAEAKEDSRILQETVSRMSTAIESQVSVNADLAKSAAEDRKVIIDAITELKATQNMIAQLLAHVVK